MFFDPRPAPTFSASKCFFHFLFSVVLLSGFHFTCELISVTCLSGTIFPIFLVLSFGLLTPILERAFAAPPTRRGENSTSRVALGTNFRATFRINAPHPRPARTPHCPEGRVPWLSAGGGRLVEEGCAKNCTQGNVRRRIVSVAPARVWYWGGGRSSESRQAS